MTKRHRTILFYILVFLFVVVAPTLLVYSLGYRVDWETKRITQTGAFFVKVSPSRADVFVNGTLQKKTDYLFGTALAGNFTPKEYELRVFKQGYHPWTKTLPITQQHVTDAKNITLIPKDISFQVVEDNILDFWVAPNQNLVLLQTQNTDRTWQLTLWDLKANSKTKVKEQESFTEGLWNIQWAKDSVRFLVEISKREQLQRFVYHTKGAECAFKNPCTLDFLPPGITDITFGSTGIFFLQQGTLFTADYLVSTVTLHGPKQVLTYLADNNTLYYLDQKGMLWANETPLLKDPISPVQETPYIILRFGNTTLLQKNSTLFLVKDLQLGELLSGVQNTRLNPNAQKIVLLTNTELWIYYLVRQEDQPQKSAGELTFLSRMSQNIENVTWLNSHYLIFTTQDAIKISEIDDRNGLNIVDIGNYKNPRIFWHAKEKVLFVLSEEKLFRSEKIIN